MKNVLLYGDINEYSAAKFVEDIDALDSEDVCARICTDGGSIDFGWAILTRFKEVTGKKLIKNDGRAYSMGAFAFLYADDREAIDTAEFMFHRAGFPDWIENNPEFFTEEDRARLERRNKSLRAAFEAKIDVPKFESITGVKVKDLFSMDGRPEVFLTAAQAKQVGLVDRVVKLTPSKKKEIDAKMQEITALAGGHKEAAHNPPSNTKPKMTASEFKAENRAAYDELVESITKEVTAKVQASETERVGEWLHFHDADPKAVKEGIASGKGMTRVQILEFSEKKAALKDVQALEEGSHQGTLNTQEPPKKDGAPEAKKKAEAEAFVDKVMKKTSLV